jgi:uncharacterized protein (UPF0276 family)
MINTLSKSYPKLIQGVGIGLRACHIPQILADLPAIPWLEIITENFMVENGGARASLEKVREHYPLAMHGIGLSLGSADPLNFTYLRKLKDLVDWLQPTWVSDHLCWTSVDGEYIPDLLPLPSTPAIADYVADRIKFVQDYLGRRILIENVSSYARLKDSTQCEWEFISEVVEKADCLLLVDINNIYVSSYNLHFDPHQYLDGLPSDRVRQIHLGGFLDCKTHLLDTHDRTVHPRVWELYCYALEKFGLTPTLIEWDTDIPALSVLLEEMQKAKEIMKNVVCIPA